MALINCRECGHQISKSAKMCPHCGFAKKQPRQYGCGSLLLVFAVGIIFLNAMDDAPTSSTKPTPAPPAAPKTAEELRTEKIAKAFSAWDGSHRQLEAYIIKQLRDPDSYEHIETRYIDSGEDTLTLYTKYRAKNGFGGYGIGEVVATAHIDGHVIKIVDAPD